MRPADAVIETELGARRGNLATSDMAAIHPVKPVSVVHPIPAAHRPAAAAWHVSPSGIGLGYAMQQILEMSLPRFLDPARGLPTVYNRLTGCSTHEDARATEQIGCSCRTFCRY